MAVSAPSSRSRSWSPAWATPGCRTTRSAARSPGGWRREGVPSGVTVMDFGTGGLDLAYEVMRGYDALVLLDASRQGGEPGTLYVMEPQLDGVRGRDRGRRDDRPARHGPGNDAAVRARHRRLAGQGRRHRLRAGRGRRGRARAHARRSRPPSSARSTLVLETVAELQTDAAYERGLMHELSVSARRRRHRGPPRAAAAGGGGECASGTCARSCRTRCVLLRPRRPGHGLRRRAPGARGRPGAAALRRAATRSGRWRLPAFRCPSCGGGTCRSLTGEELEVESIEVEEDACIA